VLPRSEGQLGVNPAVRLRPPERPKSVGEPTFARVDSREEDAPLPAVPTGSWPLQRRSMHRSRPASDRGLHH